MLLKLFMAGYRAAVNAYNHGASFGKGIKTIPKGAGFLGTNHTFILRVKVNYQYFFTDVVINIKCFAVLVVQRKLGHIIANIQRFFGVLRLAATGKKQGHKSRKYE